MDLGMLTLDEANVNPFNYVESSSQWIQALKAWAC